MKIILSLLSLVILFGTTAVNAEETSTTPKQIRQNIKETREVMKAEVKAKKQEVREKISAQKCELAQKRLDMHMKNIGAKKEKYTDTYTKLKERVVAVTTRLEKAGYDVTVLKTDLATLDTKLKEFNEASAAHIAKREEIKSVLCSSTGEEAKTKVEALKGTLATVEAKAKAIKDFYQTTVRKDIEALKAQKPAVAPATTTAPATTEESTN